MYCNGGLRVGEPDPDLLILGYEAYPTTVCVQGILLRSKVHDQHSSPMETWPIWVLICLELVLVYVSLWCISPKLILCGHDFLQPTHFLWLLLIIVTLRSSLFNYDMTCKSCGLLGRMIVCSFWKVKYRLGAMFLRKRESRFLLLRTGQSPKSRIVSAACLSSAILPHSRLCACSPSYQVSLTCIELWKELIGGKLGRLEIIIHDTYYAVKVSFIISVLLRGQKLGQVQRNNKWETFSFRKELNDTWKISQWDTWEMNIATARWCMFPLRWKGLSPMIVSLTPLCCVWLNIRFMCCFWSGSSNVMPFLLQAMQATILYFNLKPALCVICYECFSILMRIQYINVCMCCVCACANQKSC